jgi:predicted RNA-binding protein YlxR (DUF448 family)
MVRFVLAPGGDLMVDYRHKLPGRGAYSCINRSCLGKVATAGRLNRAFRVDEVRFDPQSLPEMVTEQIVIKIQSLLGMARKAGQTIAGSNLVMTELQRRSDIALVLLATDMSPGMQQKVRGYGQDDIFRQLSWLNKECLGRLLGRAERSVLALRSGPIAVTMLQELSRYDQIAGDC